MAILKGKLILEIEYEDLPVPLLGYTRAIIYRTCAEQVYYRRPWATEEDIQKQNPKFTVRLEWGKEKGKGKELNLKSDNERPTCQGECREPNKLT